MTPTTIGLTHNMLDVSDLIGVPYKTNGRDKNGFDCYGLALEVERRLGTPLNDIFYSTAHDHNLVQEYEQTLNVVKTDIITEGTLLEFFIRGELHIGVAINEENFIHATTTQGVRISRIKCYPLENSYKVV